MNKQDISMSDEEFLLAVRGYIEGVEETMDSDWGSGRSLDELIAENRMPDLYAEVLRRIGSWV